MSEGQIMWNGRDWVVLQKGKWVKIEYTYTNHEIEVEFHD